MSAERQQRLDALFDQLADEPLAEQRRVLGLIGADDPQLAAELSGLLEADADPHPFLQTSVAGLAADLLDATSDPLLPRPFGRYTLRRYLDEGGMGAVYLADRDDLGDVVAIKFLRSSWTSPARRRRFTGEQRTLARLNHPHIARLYDAGVTDGTPWFAMEYVEGSYITDYCAEKGLDLRRRLLLFRTICEAVSYAHRQLTVHLDLKPQNILVNRDGQVKLVDFGISRHLTEAGGAAQTTATDQRLLSLDYASPEQIRGEPLDVQTDVYALGIILCELITGRPPENLTALSASELARRLDAEPVAPSQLAREPQSRGVPASKAQWRELDVICLTAAHRDRTARYGSVDKVIQDLDQFLAEKPLAARTGSLRSYRLRKFLRRHRRAIAAAAAVLVLMTAMSVFYTMGLMDARDRALASDARTQRIHRLMLNLFEGDDSAAGPAEGLRVVSLLDRGVREADSLGAEPDLQAELRHTFGGLYHKLGYLDRAEPLLVSAWNTRRSTLGEAHAESVRAQLALALLRVDQSQLDEAEALVRGSLETARARQPRDQVEVATATAALGKVIAARGDYQTAVPLLEDAIRELSAQPPSVALSEAIGDLANTEYYLGHVDTSERLNLRALTLDRQLFGDRHPHVGVDLYNLGNIRLDRGDYHQGEQLFRQAAEISETWYGPAHPKTASAVLMLGRSIAYQGRLDEAGSLYERALTATRQTYDENHPRVGAVLSLSGDLAVEQGALGRAEEMFRHAAAIFKRVAGEQHEFYLHQLSNLATVCLAKQDYTEAEALLRTAVNGLAAAVPDQRYTALARIRLGAALAGQKRFEEAERQLLAGYESLTSLTGPAAVELVRARRALRDLYLALDRPARAAEFEAQP